MSRTPGSWYGSPVLGSCLFSAWSHKVDTFACRNPGLARGWTWSADSPACHLPFPLF